MVKNDKSMRFIFKYRLMLMKWKRASPASVSYQLSVKQMVNHSCARVLQEIDQLLATFSIITQLYLYFPLFL